MAAQGWRLAPLCPVALGSPPEAKKLIYHFERDLSHEERA
tara:strand:+ start:1434 stop:1553 length:120 start_codon:yes stop_codon:yes gene_type:complete